MYMIQIKETDVVYLSWAVETILFTYFHKYLTQCEKHNYDKCSNTT